jgi:hypothetical protein
VTPEIAARLAGCDIALAAQAKDYCMFVRGNCMALAQSAEERFTSIGSSGIITANGLSYLVWRDGEAWLSAHGSQIAADAEQVEAIHKFSADLKIALGLGKEN